MKLTPYLNSDILIKIYSDILPQLLPIGFPHIYRFALAQRLQAYYSCVDFIWHAIATDKQSLQCSFASVENLLEDCMGMRPA